MNMERKKLRQLFAWLLVIIWMGVIFYLSHQPATASSTLSSGITEIIIRTLKTIAPFMDLELHAFHHFIRKGAHFFAYFMLGFLVIHALEMRHVKGMALALAISVLYAISDEVHQLFIPGRSGEVRDVLIDSAGAVVGIISYRIIWKVMRKREQ